MLVSPNGDTERGTSRGTGQWTGRLGSAVAMVAAVGSLAGCLGTSARGTPGTGSPGTSSSGGNGYGGNGGDANGGGTGGNGGNGYGGWGGNGYGGNGGNGTDGRDGVDGVGDDGGDSFSDPGAVAGSGRLTTRTVDLSGVTSVVAEANFVVHLGTGRSAQAAITMDDNLTDRGSSRMHELSIATAIVEACVDRAAGSRIIRIRVEVGQLAAVLPDSLHFCFELCAQNTTAEGATLEILEQNQFGGTDL